MRAPAARSVPSLFALLRFPRRLAVRPGRAPARTRRQPAAHDAAHGRASAAPLPVREQRMLLAIIYQEAGTTAIVGVVKTVENALSSRRSMPPFSHRAATALFQQLLTAHAVRAGARRTWPARWSSSSSARPRLPPCRPAVVAPSPATRSGRRPEPACALSERFGQEPPRDAVVLAHFRLLVNPHPLESVRLPAAAAAANKGERTIISGCGQCSTTLQRRENERKEAPPGGSPLFDLLHEELLLRPLGLLRKRRRYGLCLVNSRVAPA